MSYRSIKIYYKVYYKGDDDYKGMIMVLKSYDLF